MLRRLDKVGDRFGVRHLHIWCPTPAKIDIHRRLLPLMLRGRHFEKRASTACLILFPLVHIMSNRTLIGGIIGDTPRRHLRLLGIPRLGLLRVPMLLWVTRLGWLLRVTTLWWLARGLLIHVTLLWGVHPPIGNSPRGPKCFEIFFKLFFKRRCTASQIRESCLA